MITLLTFFSLLSIHAYGAPTDNNRFNVVVVLDASGSMKSTDPNGYRFEAISQFTNLLAEQGNYLGGIVFSTNISVDQTPIAVNSQDDKARVTGSLKSVSAEGWTNTGEALLAAVDALLEQGEPTLPSVIIFLSDGNTEMATDDETAISLENKADAIQKARENGITIYSVCLNADNSADITEMEQISKATGGVFQEVSSAEDLGEVFNTFYYMIYGTSAITLIDETFSQSGIVEKEFELPRIGVEEVNIIIYGETSNLALFRPDGEENNVAVARLSSLTMLKITDIVPGVWRIVTTGVPGDQIKINMVYNTNLGINIELDGESDIIDTETPLTIKATLYSDGQSVSDSSQYEGYSAQLHVLNANDDEVTTIPMTVVENHFEVSHKFMEGAYKFKATVVGNWIDKESGIIGPVRVVAAEKVEEEDSNTPPSPVGNPVRKTVYFWPFRNASLSIDMTKLAKDNEDSTLSYRVVSSSFLEGIDYSVDGDVINITNFSLSKGSFDIRAVDSGGLACDIEVRVETHNLGLMALVGLSIGALLALLIFGIILYIAFTRPFRGTVISQSYCNGSYKGTSRTKRRGRIQLSSFGMDPTGLDYNKSYFQATGKNYIYLVTNRPVIWNGQSANKVRIQSGADVTITVNEGDNRRLYIRFNSRVKTMHRSTPARGVRSGARSKPVRRRNKI